MELISGSQNLHQLYSLLLLLRPHSTSILMMPMNFRREIQMYGIHSLRTNSILQVLHNLCRNSIPAQIYIFCFFLLPTSQNMAQHDNLFTYNCIFSENNLLFKTFSVKILPMYFSFSLACRRLTALSRN